MDNPFKLGHPIAYPPPANPPAEPPPVTVDQTGLALALGLGKLKGEEKISDAVITAAMALGESVATNPTDAKVDAGSSVYALCTVDGAPTEEAVLAAITAAQAIVTPPEPPAPPA